MLNAERRMKNEEVDFVNHKNLVSPRIKSRFLALACLPQAGILLLEAS
jgi:hypothetical protein